VSVQISAPTVRERTVSRALSALCLREIKSRNIADVADLLGISEIGVASLVWQQEWPLDVAFRIADSLGIGVVDDIQKLTDRMPKQF
jgi:predicted transcriptional regulator